MNIPNSDIENQRNEIAKGPTNDKPRNESFWELPKNQNQKSHSSISLTPNRINDLSFEIGPEDVSNIARSRFEQDEKKKKLNFCQKLKKEIMLEIDHKLDFVEEKHV